MRSVSVLGLLSLLSGLPSFKLQRQQQLLERALLLLWLGLGVENT
jgi:hypothetical protein